MVHRRSNRPATEFTKGLNRIDGPSLTATTAATIRWPTSAEESAVKITVREISASRLNQSPRLERESEIHNLRKDVIARTLCASVGAPRGADLLIALKVIDEGEGECGAKGPTGFCGGSPGPRVFPCAGAPTLVVGKIMPQQGGKHPYRASHPCVQAQAGPPPRWWSMFVLGTSLSVPGWLRHPCSPSGRSSARPSSWWRSSWPRSSPWSSSLSSSLSSWPRSSSWPGPWHGARRATRRHADRSRTRPRRPCAARRSEEHTSELQSRGHLVCRLLLEKKKTRKQNS